MKKNDTLRQARLKWAETLAKRFRRRCMGCGIQQNWLQIHEIERRSHGRKWAHTCNYLLLCVSCHAGPFATMPHAEQLAHKLYWDPEHFDLQAWLRIGDPTLSAPYRVTLREVEMQMQLLGNDDAMRPTDGKG